MGVGPEQSVLHHLIFDTSHVICTLLILFLSVYNLVVGVCTDTS